MADHRAAGRVGTGLAVVPTDLGAMLGATLLSAVVVVAGAPRAIQLPAAAALLLFLPGYAVVAALYPAHPRVPHGESERVGVGLYARLVLSVGVSLALVPLAALATVPLGGDIVAATGVAVLGRTPLIALVGVVVVGCAVAGVRRSWLPPARRFRLTDTAPVERLRRAVGPGRSTLDRVLTVALVASVVLAGGSLAYGAAAPADGEHYTTAALLTPGEDGDLVAAGYPDSLSVGEQTPLVLQLGNHEGGPVEYGVVIRAEQIALVDGETTVTDATELRRLSVAVAAGETRQVDTSPASPLAGERVRLAYYVYRGDPPAEPSADTAHRVVYVSVRVEGG